MTFGDNPNSDGALGHLGFAFFISPKLSRDKNVQAALQRYYEKTAVNNRSKQPNRSFALLNVYDPTLTGGDYKAIPTYRIFPDLGAVSMRDSWEDDAVLFTFKCGPYGGYKLNEYRHANPKDGKPHYVNIAHDDPDANGFALGTSGEFLFHPGNYAQMKKTELANTVTADGHGQIQEGDAYTQPTPETDMRTLSYLTGWKVGPEGRIIVEGEAGNAYRYPEKDAEGNPTGKMIATLKRFRRTWHLDARAVHPDPRRHPRRRREGAPHHLAGRRGEGPVREPRRGAQLRRDQERASGWTSRCSPTRSSNGSIDYVMMVGRWSGLLLNQFQFFQDTDAIKFACLLDPWKTGARMTLKEDGDIVTLTVRGKGFDDTWTWTPARDLTTPSQVEGTRDGKPLTALTEKDVAPK